MKEAKSAPWNISLPSKVFLLGEYAILAGKPGILATLSPRFSMTLNQEDENEFIETLEGKGSPVDKLRVWAKRRGAELSGGTFTDPFEGRGGFGASSAKFGLTYRAIVERMNWNERRWDQVWGLFRELLEEDKEIKILPSGADLVAQWCGGVVFFDPSQWKVEQFNESLMKSPNLFSGFTVFSATEMPGQKVVTHEHLNQLTDVEFPSNYLKYILDLNDVVYLGKRALTTNDLKLFGFCMSRYADLLKERGLENEKTFQMRSELMKLPGVLGVKGTGALQADAVITLVDTQTDHFEENLEKVKQEAAKMGLTHVQTGLFPEQGIQFESRPLH